MTRARHPRALLWLLLAALFMRAFVPQGYMPERTGSGAITVKVCGSGHVLQIPTGKREAPDQADRAEPPCAFAGLGTPALPPPAGSKAAPPTAAEPVFAAVSGSARPRSDVRPLPPARGPPPTA